MDIDRSTAYNAPVMDREYITGPERERRP